MDKIKQRYLNAIARKLNYEIKFKKDQILEDHSNKNFLIAIIYCYRMLENVIKFWNRDEYVLSESIFNSLLKALGCLNLIMEALHDIYGLKYSEKLFKDNIEGFKVYLHEEYSLYRTQLKRADGLPEEFRKDSLLIIRGVSIVSRKFKSTIERLHFMPIFCDFLTHISEYKIVVEEALN